MMLKAFIFRISWEVKTPQANLRGKKTKLT